MAGTSKNTITAAFGGNVGGRLFFAGEHTSAAYRGTVHGAFQTGQVRTPRTSPHLPRISHTYLPFTSPSPPFVPTQVAARAVKACSAAAGTDDDGDDDDDDDDDDVDDDVDDDDDEDDDEDDGDGDDDAPNSKRSFLFSKRSSLISKQEAGNVLAPATQ